MPQVAIWRSPFAVIMVLQLALQPVLRKQHANASAKRWQVLWVDAHADINTLETSETGNIHGMPLPITGHGIRLWM